MLPYPDGLLAKKVCEKHERHFESLKFREQLKQWSFKFETLELGIPQCHTSGRGGCPPIPPVMHNPNCCSVALAMCFVFSVTFSMICYSQWMNNSGVLNNIDDVRLAVPRFQGESVMLDQKSWVWGKSGIFDEQSGVLRKIIAIRSTVLALQRNPMVLDQWS